MPEFQASNWDKNGNETSHLVPARGKWELPLETMLLPLILGHHSPGTGFHLFPGILGDAGRI